MCATSHIVLKNNLSLTQIHFCVHLYTLKKYLFCTKMNLMHEYIAFSNKSAHVIEIVSTLPVKNLKLTFTIKFHKFFF